MTAEHQGQRAAQQFRAEHRLGTQPVGDLVVLIEQTTNHDVAVLDVDADEHGLTMHDPKRDVAFIAVARTPHPMRQRSTLAHELSHAVFQDWDNKQSTELARRTPEEQRADAFARNFLVPEQGIADLLAPPGRELTTADLSSVVQRFLVSPSLAAIALYNGGYIDAATKREWMTTTTPRLAAQFGWSDQYEILRSDSDRTRVPRRLLTRAIAGYQAGVVSANTIAALQGLPVQAAIDQLTSAGISPSPPPDATATADELPAVKIDWDALVGESGHGSR